MYNADMSEIFERKCEVVSLRNECAYVEIMSNR